MSVQLENYQRDAVAWITKRKVGLVCAPAGSGKTLIASAAIAHVLNLKPRHRKVKVGWLCNTTEQADQAAKALNSFPEIKQMAETRIQCAAAETDWSDRDVLIIDECHHILSPQWFSQTETCNGAKWGFTATPEVGDELRDAQLLQLFGEFFYVEREQVKASRLVQAHVMALDASDPCRQLIDAEIEKLRRIRRRQMPYASDNDIYKQVAWQACCSVGIVANQARNRAAIEAAERHMDNQVLMLVNYVEHAEWMTERLGPRAAVAHAKLGAKKRRATMDGFRSGAVRCLVATSLADEGLDLPMASVLVLVSGGRSKVKAEQRTGRVLRAFPGKEHGLIYDFLDNQHPLMSKHSRTRFELYQKLGYQIQMPGAEPGTLL